MLNSGPWVCTKNVKDIIANINKDNHDSFETNLAALDDEAGKGLSGTFDWLNVVNTKKLKPFVPVDGCQQLSIRGHSSSAELDPHYLQETVLGGAIRNGAVVDAVQGSSLSTIQGLVF